MRTVAQGTNGDHWPVLGSWGKSKRDGFHSRDLVMPAGIEPATHSLEGSFHVFEASLLSASNHSQSRDSSRFYDRIRHAIKRMQKHLFLGVRGTNKAQRFDERDQVEVRLLRDGSPTIPSQHRNCDYISLASRNGRA